MAGPVFVVLDANNTLVIRETLNFTIAADQLNLEMPVWEINRGVVDDGKRNLANRFSWQKGDTVGHRVEVPTCLSLDSEMTGQDECELGSVRGSKYDINLRSLITIAHALDRQRRIQARVFGN